VRTKLLLIDNYDSFTYNLVQAFLVLGADVHVHRNDRIGLDEAQALEPTHLCISPGPGKPADSGISMRMKNSTRARMRIWIHDSWRPDPAAQECRQAAGEAGRLEWYAGPVPASRRSAARFA